MLLGIDPVVWKYVSYWFGKGVEKLDQSITEASMFQFAAIAVVVVVVGALFLRTQRFN